MSRRRPISERGSEQGATMIEYALLAALISLVALAGVPSLGTEAKKTFNNSAQSMNQSNSNAFGGGGQGN